MSKDVVENFCSIFKALADSAHIKVQKYEIAKEHVYIKKFAKIQGLLKAYAKSVRRCQIRELSIFDIVDRTGKLHPEFVLYARKYYGEQTTTFTSQISLAGTLGSNDLEAASKNKITSKGSLANEPYNFEELPPYIREIHIVLSRAGGGKERDPEARLKRPLTNGSRDIFNALLKLDQRHDISTSEQALVQHHEELVRLIRDNGNPSELVNLYPTLYQIRKRLGLGNVDNRMHGLEIDQLPNDIREWLDNYLNNAAKGIVADPQLVKIAKANNFNDIQGHTPATILTYKRKFLWGAAHLTLTPEMKFTELMRLEERRVQKNGREYTIYVNPNAEVIRSAEWEVERPGFKKANCDSRGFVQWRTAVCTISRFNGEFAMPQEFLTAYKGQCDKDTKKERTLLKKLMFTREWVDGEIQELKRRFDLCVKKKAFLVDEEALSLCVFFVLLLTARYLGVRQQCPRKTEVGKHIIFGGDGSITFHYNKGEIKNRRIIHLVLTDKDHGGMDEIKMLMEVLKTYKKGVLDVIQKEYQEQYKRDVGRAFFVKVKKNRKDGLIQKYMRGDVGTDEETFAKIEVEGASRLNSYFEKCLYRFFDCERLRSFPYHFNIHFLRGLCCDWMIKDLKYTWEQVAKALGDKEETLKKDYYYEEEYVVDPGEAFAITSAQRRAEKAAKEGGGPVSIEVWEALQNEHKSTLKECGKAEERAENAERRAEKAERDAASLKEENEFLHAQLAQLQAA